MEQALEGKNLRKPRILVAPLDWGLGHATRCVPVIRELLSQGADVWLAGEGAQENLLKTEFPGLPFLSLRGYRVRYAGTKWGLLWSIFFQVPEILRSIKKEKAWLKKMIAEYAFDAVISDNRYGLYHPLVPCVFITHQLAIKNPWAKWTERLLQKRNYQYINRFSACWVPDEAGDNKLAGELSHPAKKPTVPLYYTGPLSRFETITTEEKKDHLLIILSGPEPQRSILENKIVDEISHYDGTATILRGLPGSSSLIPSTNMIRFYNHLPAGELCKEMMQANFVISRCGYSTVMDVAKLQRKSILIPTPGQTEQEYLAGYLMQRGIAYSVNQNSFSLPASLNAAKEFSYRSLSFNEALLKKTVERLLDKL